MKSVAVVAGAAFAGVAFVAAPLADQQKPPVFRSAANYVEVTARVVDKDGRFIDGLTAADFEIREDHRPQRVETAFRVDLPTAWKTSAGPSAAVYRPDLARELQVASGRIYLLYLNGIEGTYVPVTRQLAKDFVNSYLQTDDVVALWSLHGLVTFTSDRERLNAAIDTYLGDDQTFSGRVAGTKDLGPVPTLNSALDWFSSVQGRKKSVLLFTAGFSGLGPVNSELGVTSTATHLIDRPDVQIYAIDTRGLVAPTFKSTVGAAAGQAGADVGSQARAFSDDLTRLRWMAEDTGGFAILNHNTYQDGFRRIVEENSTYYVLGYESTAPDRPNWDYREISVKVKKAGLSGARVQARKGYVVR